MADRYRLLILGGGAVVQECYLPVLEALDVRACIIDSQVSNESNTSRLQFRRADFRAVLPGIKPGEYTHAVIALPNAVHEEAVSACLDKNLHVLCEKPLALTPEACWRMHRTACRTGRILRVNMVRRQFPVLRMARALIRAGFIGNIKSVQIEHGGTFSWPARSLAPFWQENGGVFADMGVHYLDLAEWFIGPLTPRTYADDWKGGVEAEARATLTSSNGVHVELRLSRLRSLSNQIRIEGDKGRVEVSVDSLVTATFYPGNQTTAIELAPRQSFRRAQMRASFAACFAEQLLEFFAETEEETNEGVNAESAARVAEIIHWAYAHHQARVESTGEANRLDLSGTALITGATGFIGSHLLDQLATSGQCKLRAAVRSPRNCPHIARTPVELAMTDLLSPESVNRAVAGCRYVFHLAYGRDGDGRHEATVAGTKHVVEAAIENGCEAVVILSTINVLGWRRGSVDESFPYDPMGGEYGRSKSEMEKWCLHRSRSSPRTRIVVLLPSCVYGPRGKTFTELPATLASAGAFGWIAGGGGLANFCYVGNLVDAILAAARKPEAHGERFIINDGVVSWREFLGPLVEPLQREIPSFALGELGRRRQQNRKGAWKRTLAAIFRNQDFRRELLQTSLGPAARRLGSRLGMRIATTARAIQLLEAPEAKQSFPPSWVEDLFGPFETRFSAEKAQRILGWTPRVSLEEGQARSVRYLQEISHQSEFSPRGWIPLENALADEQFVAPQ